MRIWTRVLVGGVTAALVAGAAGVAVASSTSAPGHAAAYSAKVSAGTEKKGGKGGPGGSVFDNPKTAAFLAAQLGITADQAKEMVTQLKQLAGKAGSIDSSDPAFIAIARQAKVTPQQLASALAQLKMSAK